MPLGVADQQMAHSAIKKQEQTHEANACPQKCHTLQSILFAKITIMKLQDMTAWVESETLNSG